MEKLLRFPLRQYPAEPQKSDDVSIGGLLNVVSRQQN